MFATLEAGKDTSDVFLSHQNAGIQNGVTRHCTQVADMGQLNG